ncbi:hypothetical protein C2E23DRAFT_882289 [Lenzites betulinus]|nr:hypothetical protein C2E23DRAFT_882289 [Lenzites betulinus]
MSLQLQQLPSPSAISSPPLSNMSAQQHAAIVVIDSIRVLFVTTSGARGLTRDATLANVRGQALAVQYSIHGSIVTLAAWINAFSQLDTTPFAENVATKVVADFTNFITAYTDLMIALVEKHGVLTSQGSPLAPDGLIIGQHIAAFQSVVALYQMWLASFIPTHVAELNAQGKLALDAYQLAAARYPNPSGEGVRAFEAAANLHLPQPSK